MRAGLVSAIMIVAASGGAISSWQARDANTQTPSVPTGSGVITGVVVTDTADPQPVRLATVRLTGLGSTTRLVGTDDKGRFVFDHLPSGRVTLSASKAGFVQAFHGSTRPGRGPGVLIAVADGETVDVSIRLLPGGVITGTLTDGRGSPAPGVSVAAVDTRSSGGTAPSSVRAVTDDRGVYRIFGLAPGDYLVSALPELAPASAARGGPGAGGVVTAVADADVALARNAGAGTPVGSRPAGGPAQPARPVAYAPVFYPGTSDVASATTIHVTSGNERGGIDMPLTIVTLARLAGTLVDGNGQALTSAQVSLIPKRGDQPSPVDALVASGVLTLPRAIVSASGFAFTGVSPGQYTLVARTGSGQRGAVATEAASPTLWSVTDLTVDGTDRNDLTLRLVPGLTVTGRLIFERGATPAVDPATLNLSLVATNPLPGVPSTFRAFVQSDLTFRIPSVAPGSYLTRIDPPTSSAASRWMLKSAIVDDRDLADRPLVAGPDGGDLSGLSVTFTDRAAEILGKLVDANNQPITRYSIIAFTVDRSLWLPNARRIRSITPATDGSFSIAGLPAGDYAIAAVEDVDPSDLADPTFLSQALASAYRVTLAGGERKMQDFRVGR